METLNTVWTILIKLWECLDVQVPPFNFTFQEFAIGSLMLCWGVSFVSYLLHLDVNYSGVRDKEEIPHD